MPPVTGTTAANIDPDLASRLGSPQAVAALQRGDMYEVMRLSNVTMRELDDYLKSQNRSLNQHVIQTDAIYSDFSGMPAPQWSAQFSPELGVGKLVEEDHVAFDHTLSQMMGHSKAMMSGAGKADDKVPLDPELAAYVEGNTAEAQQVYDTFVDKAMENQLQADFTKKNAELKQKFLEILANAKDPATILMALTQYSARRAGLVVELSGSRVGMIQRQQSRLSADQTHIATDDPKFYAKTESYREQMSEGSTNLQQQISMMQTATQNVESAMSFGKTGLDKLNETANTLIRALQARGG